MTTYIAFARNPSDGDMALYGVIDFTIEARDRGEAARQVRERHGYFGAIAIVPAVYFAEYGAAERATADA